MAKEVMTRNAADNEYLHKDFHGAMSTGIQYLHEHYGEDGVREYLRRFTDAWHAPLKQAILDRGLTALKDYFEEIYRIEDGDIKITCSDDELVLTVAECPAVAHMKANGYRVADLWIETTRTIGQQLVAGSPFAFELVEYDDETGHSVQRFFRA